MPTGIFIKKNCYCPMLNVFCRILQKMRRKLKLPFDNQQTLKLQQDLWRLTEYFENENYLMHFPKTFPCKLKLTNNEWALELSLHVLENKSRCATPQTEIYVAGRNISSQMYFANNSLVASPINTATDKTLRN